MTWHLDTDFPGANACGAAISHHAGQPALSLAADPDQGAEALWFRVRLRRLDGAAPAPWLILRHVDTLLGAGDGGGLQPVARCDGGGWQRLARGTPVEHPDGRREVLWRLPEAAAVVEVAFCHPYGQDELDRLLAATRGRLRVDAIGSCGSGRPLLRLSNRAGDPGSTRPGVYLLARHHAGETPGSWVLDGILRRLADIGDAAPMVWAVPFVDADGVASGAYGKDRGPVDFNRSWWIQARRHEVGCIMADIARWQARCRPLLCLDLHAPTGCERDGTYTFGILGDASVPAALQAWWERLASALGPELASSNFLRQGNYPSRWAVDLHPPFVNWANGRGLPALSLESSYQGLGDRAFAEADYLETGRRIADALCAGEPA